MVHKTRKINIAYRSSKWWQWCTRSRAVARI